MGTGKRRVLMDIDDNVTSFPIFPSGWITLYICISMRLPVGRVAYMASDYINLLC